MKVKITVNQQQLLRALRRAFSHRDAMLRELLQNARRAGASRVVIDHDEARNVLVVSDDGCGIRHFQNLFTLCESGWNPTIQESEQPYGLGFLSCLYAAKTCSIVSLGRKILFDTEALLDGAEVEDQHADEPIGTTRISLYGVPLNGLADRMPQMVCGFPIPVIFNGVSLRRPFARDAIQTEACTVGQVCRLGAVTGWAGTSSLLFLQGHLVHGDWTYGRYSNIVHLDSARYRARLPDRYKLIDEDHVLAQVDAALRDLWRGHIRHERSILAPQVLIERFFQPAKTWGVLDELDEVPALPAHLFQRITDYPVQAGYREEAYLSPLQRTVLREEVESKRVKLIELDALSNQNAPYWMLARERQMVCFQDPGLSEAHWVHPYVRRLEDEPLTVDVIGEVLRIPLQGVYLWREVVMCEAYVIVVGSDRITVRDEGLSWPPGTGILIPENECSGQAVEQASDFIDSMDRYHEDDLHLDRDALRELIRRMRAQDPKQALESLIVELKLERYPSLRGRSFALHVGRQAQSPQVEVLH